MDTKPNTSFEDQFEDTSQQSSDQKATDSRDKMHFIIQSLISDNHVENSILHTCLEELKVDIHTPKRIILIQMNPPAALSNIPVFQSKVLYQLKSLHLNLFDYNYPDKYYILTDTALLETVLPALREFAATHSDLLKIAIGKSCRIPHLKTSCISADFALQSLLKTNRNFAHFDSMALESLLLELPLQTQKDYLYIVLGQLSEEDIAFLKVYFKEGHSLNKTGKRLYMHKNTVQYQLSRIAERIGYNPRNFYDAVLLQIALKLWDKMQVSNTK